MKLGLIDLGSNSARMYLVSLDEGGYEVLARRRVMTRLSEGMGDDTCLKEPAMARTAAVMKNFADEIQQAGAYPFAVATAAVRTAKNREEFLARIRNLSGLDLFVLSGETEAFFDFCGVLAGLPHLKNCLICDTGGGSTELILSGDGAVKAKVSLPFGAMTLTDAYGTRLCDAKAEVLSRLDAVPFLAEAEGLPLVGIGGSVCAIGYLDKNSRDIHAHSISRSRCRELFDTLLPLTPKQRISLGVEQGRADTICAGFLPSLLLMERFSMPSLTLCTSNLREGILAELTKNNPEFYTKNPELFLENYV